MPMTLNPKLLDVTRRISERSKPSRAAYLERMQNAQSKGPARGHLSCSGQAHAYAAMARDKDALAEKNGGNLAIVTAYNDMLSAHQPFALYPDLIKDAVREVGGTAQVAGGVPAMCDGVTQGEAGMELSLFSRDLIAMSACVALSHNTYDAAVFLGGQWHIEAQPAPLVSAPNWHPRVWHRFSRQLPARQNHIEKG